MSCFLFLLNVSGFFKLFSGRRLTRCFSKKICLFELFLFLFFCFWLVFAFFSAREEGGMEHRFAIRFLAFSAFSLVFLSPFFLARFLFLGLMGVSFWLEIVFSFISLSLCLLACMLPCLLFLLACFCPSVKPLFGLGEPGFWCQVLQGCLALQMVLRHGGCHDGDGTMRCIRFDTLGGCWAYSRLEERENWNHVLSLFTNPERSIAKHQHGTIVYIRAVQRHRSVLHSIKPCFLGKRYGWVGKTTFHTASFSNLKSIPENGFWTGGLSLRNTRQACLFSHPNPQES